MIAAGVRCDSAYCPLALAFKNAGFNVMVADDHVDFYDDEGSVCATLELPQVARNFQKQFDDGQTPGPFAFEMPDLQAGVLPFTHFHSVAV